MNKKLMLVDLCGFAWLCVVFLIYNRLESRYDDWLAVVGAMVISLPGILLWHRSYNQYSRR